MTNLTNLLLGALVIVILVDIWYTRKWLRKTEQYLRELHEYADRERS